MKYSILLLLLIAAFTGKGQLTKIKPHVKYDSIRVEITTDPPSYEWEYYPVGDTIDNLAFAGTDSTWKNLGTSILPWPVEKPHKYDTVWVHGLCLVVDTAMDPKDLYLDGGLYLIFWQQKQIDSLIHEMRRGHLFTPGATTTGATYTFPGIPIKN
jgi:hypothetical protein